MRRGAFLLVALLLAGGPPASAQDAAAPADADAPSVRLFLHNIREARTVGNLGAAPSTTENVDQWLSPIEADQTATDSYVDFDSGTARRFQLREELDDAVILDASRLFRVQLFACPRVNDGTENGTVPAAGTYRLTLTVRILNGETFLAGRNEIRSFTVAPASAGCGAPEPYLLEMRPEPSRIVLAAGSRPTVEVTWVIEQNETATVASPVTARLQVRTWLRTAADRSLLEVPVAAPLRLDLRVDVNEQARTMTALALVRSPFENFIARIVPPIIEGPSAPRTLAEVGLVDRDTYRWDWDYGADGASPGDYAMTLLVQDIQGNFVNVTRSFTIPDHGLVGAVPPTPGGDDVALTEAGSEGARGGPFDSAPFLAGLAGVGLLALLILLMLLVRRRERDRHLDVVQRTYEEYRADADECIKMLKLVLQDFEKRAKASEVPERVMPAVRERVQKYVGLLEKERVFIEKQIRSQVNALSTLGDPVKPGKVAFGKYRVVRVLGEGAFGKTYLAEDESLERPVVIKELLAHWRRDKRVAESFLREARLAGQLNHPNIVTIYEVKQRSGDTYIIMEYVDGASLEQLVQRRKRVPLHEALTYADHVLQALAAVHKRNIWHRDVKPSNILVNKGGTAKLVDFGIAHSPTAGESSLRLSATGVQPGTVLFMSPEQAKGQPVDARSDLYSVGAVMYHLLSGENYLPFDGKSEWEARQLVIQSNPRLPIAKEPAWVNAILAKALAKDPRQRFQNADEFRTAIRKGIAELVAG